MRRTAIIAAAAIYTGLMAGCGSTVTCGDAATDQKAANCAAWSIFAQMNRAAAPPSADAQWERWGEASQVFNPNGPVWPTNPPGDKHLEKLRQLALLTGLMDTPPAGLNSEVRVNRPTFDFVVRNSYYKTEGLAKAPGDLDFPKEAISIKAKWEENTEPGTLQNYHWQFAEPNHRKVRLVALHMSSKIIPNWLWATWKHESTPEDGSDDLFGYPNGKLSPELRKLFEANHVPPEWYHYRLIGTQTEYVDSKGRPRLLGNSKIEGSSKTSCISCHAMARIDTDGLVYSNQQRCRNCDCCALTGAPDPTSFEGTRQLDFVWAFMRLKPDLKPCEGCVIPPARPAGR